MTKTDREKIKSIVRKEIRSERQELEKEIEKQVKKQFKGREFDDFLKKKMGQIISNFHRTLWVKSSFWKNSI